MVTSSRWWGSQAYADLLAGSSVRGIAARWNDAGVATSTGARWSGASVTQMLRNARYAAIRTYGRDKQRVEVGPATWTAVVPEDVWRAAVAVLTDPGRHVGSTRERVHLLSGLTVCGVCQHPMSSGRATSTGASTYVCKPLHHLSRATAPVDALVRAVVVKRLSRPDARELLVDDKPDLEPVRREALALRARLDSLATEIADGELTPGQLRTATKRITEKLAAADAQLISVSRAPVLADLISAKDVGRAFDDLPLDRKRAVVTALVTVTVLPTGRGRKFDPESVRVKPA